MDIGSLSGTTALTGAAAPVAGNPAEDGLNRDAFLRLLVTQLKNQNPLEPVGNEDFIAQLAQFSMLENGEGTNERLSSLLRVEQLGQGAALIGRRITYTDPSSGEALPGIVSAVELSGGEVQVDIGGQKIPLSNVLRVDGAPVTSETLGGD